MSPLRNQAKFLTGNKGSTILNPARNRTGGLKNGYGIIGERLSPRRAGDFFPVEFPGVEHLWR
jgi:hypothetical protein